MRRNDHLSYLELIDHYNDCSREQRKKLVDWRSNEFDWCSDKLDTKPLQCQLFQDYIQPMIRAMQKEVNDARAAGQITEYVHLHFSNHIESAAQYGAEDGPEELDTELGYGMVIVKRMLEEVT